tara:strand:+ start:1355 stop:2002 length:648 start_codon:yes stop_codon:yes gene_type:complete
MKKAYHIAVEGSIGVGKTSLSRILSEKLKCKLILEEFEENPFLSEFYKDPDRYAFQTQLFFLLSRYKQQIEFQQLDIFTSSIVSDYMFMKDRIFASLNLNDKEMSLYDNVALILEKNMIHPDLIIFLQSDTDRLMKNIKSRGRNYELNMDWNYIDALNQIYNEFFFRYDKSPLLIINTNDIDFVNDKNDLNEILGIIQRPINGTKYYNPNKSLKL